MTFYQGLYSLLPLLEVESEEDLLRNELVLRRKSLIRSSSRGCLACILLDVPIS